MKRLALAIGVMGIAFAGSSLADTYGAQSAVKGDACSIKATATMVTDANGNKINGVLFQASHDDGDRLDVHCKNVVVKFGMGINQVFVAGMTSGDIKRCVFHEHDASAGMDHEKGIKTSAKLTKTGS